MTTQSQKDRSALDEVQNGAFKRVDSSFRNWITATGENGSFPAEPGRYHLYISYACPWASRCAAMLYLKGLEDIISLSVTSPTWQRTNTINTHRGWVFTESLAQHPEYPDIDNGHDADCIPDTINHCKTIRDVYLNAHPNYDGGKYTVPILFDKKTNSIVSNESSEIIRMFNTAFNAFAKYPTRDFYPEALRQEIDELNGWIYDGINNGVYKCGFATKQQAYHEAVTKLFDSLDRVEEILSKKRFLVGDGTKLTEADIRLFVTLIRFDHVYTIHFKCAKKQLREYPNIIAYTKDIYQMEGVKHSVKFKHFDHYYRSHPGINPYLIVPETFPYDFNAPHGREKLSSVNPL